MLKISSSGTSNAGKKKTNEDNFYMNGIFAAENNAATGRIYSDNTPRNTHFYAVFDGIGDDISSDLNPNIKFNDGENASYIAADMLARLQRHLKTKEEYNLNEYVYRFVKKTNRNICDYMNQKGIRTGTSFALLCIEKNHAVVYNVGNSKIFILRDNRLLPVSYNDTKAESLVMAKQISSDIVRYTPDNKILTQFLGIYENEKPLSLHISEKIALRNGDKFLVCSDGLCDLPNERIYQIMARDISEQEIVTDLINEAMQNGTRDNLSVIVVGVNYSDEKTNKSDLLKPTSADSPTHFNPITYRSKFSFKPKHIKYIIYTMLLAVIFILAIFLLFNGPFKRLSPEKPTEGTTAAVKETTNGGSTDSNAAPGENTGNVAFTTEEITYSFDIPTYDEKNTTERSTTGNGATATASSAPITTVVPAVVTSPPATVAPATAAPVTNPPVTNTSDVNATVTTSAPVTTAGSVAETTAAVPTAIPTEAPTEIPTETPTEAPTEAPTEIPTEPPTEAPTELPTEAPTEAVTNPPETEPPAAAEEETIAAE